MSSSLRTFTTVKQIIPSNSSTLNPTPTSSNQSHSRRLSNSTSKYKPKISILENLPNINLPFIKRLNILNIIIVFGLPLLSIYGVLTTHSIIYQTWIWALIYYLYTGIGITAGYHRLWSHKSYECNLFLKLFLMVGGSGALQGSIKWWALLHRAHHRYTDTSHDPYNANRGFFYCHCGWLLLDKISIAAYVELKDLRSEKLVEWQHKHFPWFGIFMALMAPALVAWIFWNDFRGGFFIAGVLRLVIVHHSTWCVNSVAHFFGSQSFDDTISPKDSIITSLLTFGEGYHNFHHEFPHDYRNGIRWYDYDPTKWFIFFCSKLGFVHKLNTFPKNEIARGKWEMRHKEILNAKSEISFGVDIESLPIWSKSEIDEYCNGDGRKRICILFMNVVYDVTEFVGKHPGGKKIILDRNMKDVTFDMNGLVYNHTNAARNLMAHMRVAKFVSDEGMNDNSISCMK